jgi:hypothetical protein
MEAQRDQFAKLEGAQVIQINGSLSILEDEGAKAGLLNTSIRESNTLRSISSMLSSQGGAHSSCTSKSSSTDIKSLDSSICRQGHHIVTIINVEGDISELIPSVF